MWLDAGLQARDWLGPATLVYLIKELVENRMEHVQLLDKLDWYILPIANPDGYAYTMSNGKTSKPSRLTNLFNIKYCIS